MVDRRAAALARLQYSANENEFERQMALERYQAMMEAAKQRREMEKQQAIAEEAKRKKQWTHSATAGAQMGSSFGPWGALIGGIAGSAKGMGEAWGQRRKEGESGWGAFKNTIGDTGLGVNLGEGVSSGNFKSDTGFHALDKESMGNAASAIANAKGYQDRKNAQKQAAAEQGGDQGYAGYNTYGELGSAGSGESQYQIDEEFKPSGEASAYYANDGKLKLQMEEDPYATKSYYSSFGK